jgi:hypothetical protein
MLYIALHFRHTFYIFRGQIHKSPTNFSINSSFLLVGRRGVFVSLLALCNCGSFHHFGGAASANHNYQGKQVNNVVQLSVAGVRDGQYNS